MLKNMFDRLTQYLYLLWFSNIPEVDTRSSPFVNPPPSPPLAPTATLTIPGIPETIDNDLRYEFESNDEWQTARLTTEIKIDTDGKIYFKQGSRWVEQVNIKAISFARE